MTHTEYQDPKFSHTSWMQWIEENIAQAKDFYGQAIAMLEITTKNILYRLSKEFRFFVSKLTIVDFICLSVTLAVLTLASLFLFFGIGIIFYQLFLWMKSGVWPQFSIEVVFNFIFENTLLANWLSNPESWFGLQKILEWLLKNIPLSAALIIPSILIFTAMACISAAAIAFRFYQFKISVSKAEETREN